MRVLPLFKVQWIVPQVGNKTSRVCGRHASYTNRLSTRIDLQCTYIFRWHCACYGSDELELPYNKTNLLTPWRRVLLEKLTVNFAASQEIPRIYGTRKFLTVPTSARHLSLS
jgi:hypothetical protein